MQISTLLSLSLSLFLFSYSFSLSSVQGFDFLHEPSSGDYSPPPHSSFISPAPVTENGGGSGGGLEPAPAPHSGDDAASSPYLSPTSDYGGYSPPSPMSFISPAPMTDNGEGSSGGGNSDETAPSRAPTEETGPNMIRWCAVRDEFDNCENFVSLLQPDAYKWKCVKRDTTQECLESIKRGEADIINLEAGLAYIAFVNYSMKAIGNEVYCDQTKSYLAVAVVSRKACEDNAGISLLDFKGKKSCHGGYSTATGWNYPITHIKTFIDSEKMNDKEIAAGFFSKVCAPSEFQGSGVCTGCGDENGLCPTDSLYFGHLGAFRCLLEDMGNIAFVRADTALLYSMEGPHNQSWSTKSIRDFMYLCPQGGCREINGYPGACSYGRVPADVIMASNSIPNKKRLFVLEMLMNATREGKVGASNVLSPSTQGLDVIKKVTRSYLDKSALVSQSIHELNTPKTEANSSKVNPKSDVSSVSCIFHAPAMMFISILSILVFDFMQ